jgi:hypothetical protein
MKKLVTLICTCFGICLTFSFLMVLPLCSPSHKQSSFTVMLFFLVAYVRTYDTAEQTLLFAQTRVARWFIFNQKIPILVNFGGSYIDWKMLLYFMAIFNILQTFGICYDNLVHFVFIWYILCSFGTCFMFWYNTPRKIWQHWSKQVSTAKCKTIFFF